MNILRIADKIVNGPRRKHYGHPSQNFALTAHLWSAILHQTITPEQVGLCMIAVKLAREIHVHTADNLVDIAGYAQTVELVHAAKGGR